MSKTKGIPCWESPGHRRPDSHSQAWECLEMGYAAEMATFDGEKMMINHPNFGVPYFQIHTEFYKRTK